MAIVAIEWLIGINGGMALSRVLRFNSTFPEQNDRLRSIENIVWLIDSGCGMGETHLFIVSIDGGAVKMLPDAASPHWESRDWTILLF